MIKLNIACFRGKFVENYSTWLSAHGIIFPRVNIFPYSTNLKHAIFTLSCRKSWIKCFMNVSKTDIHWNSLTYMSVSFSILWIENIQSVVIYDYNWPLEFTDQNSESGMIKFQLLTILWQFLYTDLPSISYS